jgi:DNA-binding CsgD family transcriptional regulator
VTERDSCPDPAFPPKREKAGWERRPIRVALDIADRALRADIADTCEDADIAVAKDADVVLADRPVETAVPVIALVSGETRRVWPANVRAVVPADIDATMLAAIVIVVAAGYALLPRKDHGPPPYPPPPPSLALPRERGREGWGKGEGREGEGREGDADPADEPGSALSPREHEVLALLAEGASNKEIARALGLSVHTVKFHIATLNEKLGARSRVEAVAIAIRSGLVMA